jgi:hypothetical protein
MQVPLGRNPARISPPGRDPAKPVAVLIPVVGGTLIYLILLFDFGAKDFPAIMEELNDIRDRHGQFGA